MFAATLPHKFAGLPLLQAELYRDVMRDFSLML